MTLILSATLDVFNIIVVRSTILRCAIIARHWIEFRLDKTQLRQTEISDLHKVFKSYKEMIITESVRRSWQFWMSASQKRRAAKETLEAYVYLTSFHFDLERTLNLVWHKLSNVLKYIELKIYFLRERGFYESNDFTSQIYAYRYIHICRHVPVQCKFFNHVPKPSCFQWNIRVGKLYWFRFFNDCFIID